MDKKDLKGMLKFFTIIYFTMIAGVGTLGNFFVACIYALTNGGGFFENFWSNTVTLFTAFFYLTLVIYTGIVVAGLMLKVRRKSEMVESKDYVRDLPEYFPPAIASFLLDLSIETTDYTATIAYLIAKGYITIDKDDKVTLNKDSILNLAKHERYVLQAVLGNNKYNHEDFKRYVVEDAEKMGYIKRYTLLSGIFVWFLSNSIEKREFDKIHTNIFETRGYVKKSEPSAEHWRLDGLETLYKINKKYKEIYHYFLLKKLDKTD